MRNFLLAAACVLILAGCGGGGDSDTSKYLKYQTAPYEILYLSLDGEPGPQNAGFPLGEKLGYFRDVGIQARISSPNDPSRLTADASRGVAKAAIAHEPEVVLARDKGLPVVIFGSLIAEPTMAMIWLPKSGVRKIADLKGKTIAFPGLGFQKDFLEFVLEGAGLTLADVKLEKAGDGLVDALASGRADAIFGGSGNEEGAALETRGFAPVVTGVAELGVPGYDELVLIAGRDAFEKEPELFERIRDAAIRGNRAAPENPEEATDAVVDQSLGTLSPIPIQAGIEATAPLLSQTGDVDEEQLEELIDWMHEQGMTRRTIPASDLLANP